MKFKALARDFRPFELTLSAPKPEVAARISSLTENLRTTKHQLCALVAKSQGMEVALPLLNDHLEKQEDCSFRVESLQTLEYESPDVNYRAKMVQEIFENHLFCQKFMEMAKQVESVQDASVGERDAQSNTPR